MSYPTPPLRPIRLSRPLLWVFCAGFVGLSAAHAQELSADEVLANLEARSESLQDVSFLLTGTIFDTDGQEINLEIDTQFLPAEELLRAYFIQPDALTDNFVVVDGETVYNYLYVTNQITILNADDPDALGGLLPQGGGGVESEVEGAVNLTPDLNRVFGADAWDSSVEGYEESPDGPVYLLRFENRDETANIEFVTATVLDGDWLPQSLSMVQQDGSTLAELFFQNYAVDAGLEASELRFIPQDAEQIDQR